jgi:MFS family permease
MAGAMLCVVALEGVASREWLFGVSIALGALRAFQMPAQQALTPSLVPPSLLPSALAISSGGVQTAIIAGPALGGLLYVAGASVTYAACTAFLLVAATLCAGIRYERGPRAGGASLASLLAGLRFVYRRKVVLGAISLDLFAVLLGGATALLPIYAKDVLHVGSWGLGLLRAAPAAGAVVMSVVLTRWPLERRTGHRLLGAVGLYGVTIVVFGLSSSFLLSLAMLAIGGAADMVSVVVRQALVQIETPDEMRGRVSAVNSVFIGASNQLGEFESGAVAAWLGTVPSVVIGGLGTCLVAALWWRLFPELARRDRLVAEAPVETLRRPAFAATSGTPRSGSPPPAH